MTDPTELRERAARLEAERQERERERREREREERRGLQERERKARQALEGLDRDALEVLATKPDSSAETPGRLSTNAVELMGSVAAELTSAEIESAAAQILQERRAEQARADGGAVQSNARVGFVSEISAADLLIIGGIAWAILRP